MGGHQQFAVRRHALARDRIRTRADSSRVVFEAVEPVGMVEADGEHERHRRTSALRRRTPRGPRYVRGVTAGTPDHHTRCHFVLVLERPQLAAVRVHEPCGVSPKRIREARRHGDAGEVGRLPELDLGGRDVDLEVGRSRSFTPSTSSPPTWSMCMWVSTTSVTDARSMPAASSRWITARPAASPGTPPPSRRR